MGLVNGTFFLGRSQFRACSAPRDASRSDCPWALINTIPAAHAGSINEFSTRCLTAIFQVVQFDTSMNIWMQSLAGKMRRQGCFRFSSFPFLTFLLQPHRLGQTKCRFAVSLTVPSRKRQCEVCKGADQQEKCFPIRIIHKTTYTSIL